MGHIPYGYRIEKGAAVIDKDAAARIKVLYSGYLGGLSLEAAAKEAGIGINHSRAKHILRDRRYLGDGFYPRSSTARASTPRVRSLYAELGNCVAAVSAEIERSSSRRRVSE